MEKIPHKNSVNVFSKSFNDWNQTDLDVALKNPKELQEQLLGSAEIFEFSDEKFKPESLNNLKIALEGKVIVGMKGDDVSFVQPLTKGLKGAKKLEIKDKKI